MSLTQVLPLRPQGMIQKLVTQSSRRAVTTERLVLTCPEPVPGIEAVCSRALGQPLVLEMPGASVEHPGVEDALLHAVYELGVREIVVIAHSDCRHLPAADSRPSSLPETAFERLQQGLLAVRRRLEAAGDRVRSSIDGLTGNTDLAARVRSGDLQLVGLVYASETGLFFTHDSDTDELRPVVGPAGGDRR